MQNEIVDSASTESNVGANTTARGTPRTDAVLNLTSESSVSHKAKLIMLCRQLETELTNTPRLLDVADVFYGVEEDDPPQGRVLNMNDTFGWAIAWGEPVPEEKLKEVTSLFARYGNHGLNYWVSEQHDRMRSEFEDINRGIDFVRQEELVRTGIPSSTKRAYFKHSYVLGGAEPPDVAIRTTANNNVQDE